MSPRQLSDLPVALITLIPDVVTVIARWFPFSCLLVLSMTLVVMLGTQDMAARAILMFGGAGAVMGRVLAVGAMMRAIGAMTSFMTFSVTVMTDNGARGWVRGWVTWSNYHCY